MQQLLNFFFKNRTLILFLFLLSLSFGLTISSQDYQKSKFINSSAWVSGSIHTLFSDIGDYFYLKKENALLLAENNRLKSREYSLSITPSETLNLKKEYKLTPAAVVKNSYGFLNNYLTLDKGRNDQISEDLGVVNSRGIVGIIDKTTSKFSRVISILNTKSKVNAKLKKNNYFGSLEWNGENPRLVQLYDIQDLVKLNKGDTIVTSGYSSIFPENIPIGAIAAFKLNDTKDLYIIDVALFNDMTNLRHVHIIENLNKEELQILSTQDE